MKSYCSSPEQEVLRARQLDELWQERESSGVPVIRRALSYPGSVPGVSVTLLGARNTEQLEALLKALRD